MKRPKSQMGGRRSSRNDQGMANSRAAREGTTVRAIAIDAATAKLMVKINSLNSSEIKPPNMRKGSTATRLVLVEASRADSNSWAEVSACWRTRWANCCLGLRVEWL